MPVDATTSVSPPSFIRSPSELSPSEKQDLQQLKLLDAEVRLHEHVHAMRSVGYIRSAPSYTYKVGPDGRSYAVNGEVTVDGAAPTTPEEAIAKARVLGMAASAPTDSSVQDGAAAMDAYAYVHTAQQIIMNRQNAANLGSDQAIAASIDARLRRYSYVPLNPSVMAWV